jgi:hypothetical protein
MWSASGHAIAFRAADGDMPHEIYRGGAGGLSRKEMDAPLPNAGPSTRKLEASSMVTNTIFGIDRLQPFISRTITAAVNRQNIVFDANVDSVPANARHFKSNDQRLISLENVRDRQVCAPRSGGFLLFSTSRFCCTCSSCCDAMGGSLLEPSPGTSCRGQCASGGPKPQ